MFAVDLSVADALYRSLIARVPGQPVYLDTPDRTANANADELVRRHALIEVFQAARMYTKSPPPVALDQIYGITSMELG